MSVIGGEKRTCRLLRRLVEMTHLRHDRISNTHINYSIEEKCDDSLKPNPLGAKEEDAA
jgi:hypothetical protein